MYKDYIIFEKFMNGRSRSFSAKIVRGWKLLVYPDFYEWSRGSIVFRFDTVNFRFDKIKTEDNLYFHFVPVSYDEAHKFINIVAD